jgi:uncharacterized protein
MRYSLKRPIILVIAAIIIPFGSAFAAGSIPPPPDPPRLVNDFAGILQPSQVNELEHKLVAFSDSTTTQIVVVTISSLDGYDISDFTQRLGQSWGVGKQKYNNGCVILVKPKTDTEKGEADIETGYGLEHLITDGDCWKIVNNEMIPYFKQNDYYGGINAGIDAVIKFTTGAYKSDTYGKGGNEGTPTIVIIIVIIGIILLINRSNRNNHRTLGGNNGMGPIIWPGSSGGHWGGFSGGSGGFGGGGGFGGFGGGSFGGGGASGSW